MKPFDELSARQRRILRYIDQYTVEHGYPPTIREIGEATDTASTSVVNYNLNKLVEEEYLEREQRVSRGVRLITRIPNTTGEAVFRQKRAVRASSQGGVSVPLVGSIAAGKPLPLPEDIGQRGFDEDDMLEVTSMMLGGIDPSEVFALKIQGNSMIDAMISDGDIVLLKKQPNANNGDMVAVWLANESETTLKYYYHEGDRIRLQPAHPQMAPIYVDAANCQIQGKVLSVLRRLK